MTDSWWAKKLGRAPAPAGQPSYGPTGPPNGSITPAGTQAQMWQGQQESGPPPLMVEDPSAPNGERLNWRAWTGGRGNREETGTCPNCGSSNYFSRRQNAMVTQNGMAHPAPQCFECSYNGVFQIFGGG
jgi:hypothetical protein